MKPHHHVNHEGCLSVCTVTHRRFQDGAATANNPAAIALTEARLLWPDARIDCLVSLGSGAVPPARRERSMSAYLDTGSVLIEVPPPCMPGMPCALAALAAVMT